MAATTNELIKDETEEKVDFDIPEKFKGTDTEALAKSIDLKVNSELMVEELRLAIQEIGKITGHVDVEEYLEVIFKDFCIGK